MSAERDDPAVGPGAAAELLQGLLRRTHLSTPDDLPRIVAEHAGATLGAEDVALLLIDYEQRTLVPLRIAGEKPMSPHSVAGTVAGRAFSSTAILTSPAEGPERQRLWIPLLDGTERLGVLGMTFAEDALDEAFVTSCERYAHLVAMLVVTKSAYGDTFEVARRQRPMTIASELLWGLAPPLVFATDGVALAGLLEPCYDNGGDALDYALDGGVLHLAVFDAMGHGLAAAGVAAFAVSAYRHSRRRGSDLLETHAAMHDAVGHQFPDSRFVTALIAELEIDSGRLTWVSAGHPPPLVIREARRTRTLAARPAPPLGVEVGIASPELGHEALEPGDQLLLYTDGLTEARSLDGALLGLEGLSGFIAREAAGGQTAPETLRRLRESILVREQADLRDDATALLVQWRRVAAADVVPQTVIKPDDD